MGHMSTPRAPYHRDDLIKALTDPITATRDAAVEALLSESWSDLGNGRERTVEELASLLQHFDWKVRWIAAESLSRIADPACVEGLLAVRSGMPQVRSAVARALGNIGDPRSLAALRKASQDDDASVQIEAWAGLVRLG